MMNLKSAKGTKLMVMLAAGAMMVGLMTGCGTGKASNKNNGKASSITTNETNKSNDANGYNDANNYEADELSDVSFSEIGDVEEPQTSKADASEIHVWSQDGVTITVTQPKNTDTDREPFDLTISYTTSDGSVETATLNQIMTDRHSLPEVDVISDSGSHWTGNIHFMDNILMWGLTRADDAGSVRLTGREKEK